MANPLLQKVHFSETTLLSRLISDYLKGAKELSSLFAEQPDTAGILRQAEKKSTEFKHRNLLFERLNKRYAEYNLSLSSSQTRNLELLIERNTLTICTAHQPCLFTGPLYVVYKIVSCIKLADQLNQQQKDFNFVPVYYLGSEDHDFEEVNHFYYFGKKYKWNLEGGSAVGRMPLTGLEELLTQIQQALTGSYAKELFLELSKCYKLSKTFGEASFKLINRLFKDKGLLIVDTDDRAFKKAFKGQLKAELFEQNTKQVLQESLEHLNLHYKQQAYVRDINLFFIGDKKREQIKPNANGFLIGNKQLSSDEMEALLEEEVENFSPNVITRPLYQEFVLPNAAFIGGPGELAYWLQLKPMFLHRSIPFPVLTLRDSALHVFENQWLFLQENSLTLKNIFSSVDQNMQRLVTNQTMLMDLSDAFKQFSDIIDDIGKESLLENAGLARALQASKQKGNKVFKSLERKIHRYQKSKFQAEKDRLVEIDSLSFPTGVFQERYMNLLEAVQRFESGFIESLYPAFDPLDKQLKIFVHAAWNKTN